MHWLKQLLAAYAVGLCCTVAVQAPRHLMRHVAFISTVGWLAYLLMYEQLHLTVGVANYAAGLVIAGMAHWFARRYQQPVTVFFIPGFFTLVPGGRMYLTALHFIQGDNQLALQELLNTFVIAVAIALAVFTVDTLMNLLNQRTLPKFIRPNRQKDRAQK